MIAIILAVNMMGHAAPNPVLPGTGDCGVLRYNGQYYLMGVGTDGGMHVSNDLVTWSERVHVFSMANDWATGSAGADSEIHACAMRFHNGRFHLYWSVNHGDLRQIGHAVSNNVLGPYREPVTEAPFDGRIDPDLFVDEDGAMYFYTVKFTDGNVIWGQPMRSPWALRGEARPLLSAREGTWELQDHKVNEAQTVIRYRDRYYMLFNANHTGHEYGHYAIGAAVSGTPLGFSNETKYPRPVLEGTRRRILSQAKQLTPIAVNDVPRESPGVTHWRYVTAEPSEGWSQRGYDDQAWNQGEASFGNPQFPMPRGAIRTPWDSGALWLRQTFAPDETPSEQLYLLLNHDGPVEVYLNGCLALRKAGFQVGYALYTVPPEARATVHAGERNVLAVHARHDGEGAQFVDVGLLDLHGPAQDIIHNCGQPSLVRGPNGFEWWVVYFAMYNGGLARSQAIDRVHFMDGVLTVDGPTSAKTPGYHPAPSMPTASAGDDRKPLPMSPGDDGRLRPEGLRTSPPARSFLFETVARLGEGDGFGWGQTCLAFDPENTALVLNDRPLALYDGFDPTGQHAYRIERNGRYVHVWADDVRLTGSGVMTASAAPALPGFIGPSGGLAGQGFTYTRGWDEWGSRITDWDGDVGWTVDDRGLHTPDSEEETRVFKGDALSACTFSVDAYPGTGTAGVYAVHAGEEDWLRAGVDHSGRELRITGRRNGNALPPSHFPLPASLSDTNVVHLRVEKLADRVILFANGEETATVEGAWPPARVGLWAEGRRARFDGIMCYERVETHER